MDGWEIGIDETAIGVGPDEIGFSFGKLVKGIGRGVSSAAKATANVSRAIVQSPITKTAVGVVAVAFPAVGVPAAAAVATANLAIDRVQAGKVAISTVNANISKLKRQAEGGNRSAAHAVNAMQVAIAQRKARKVGKPAPRPVAAPARHVARVPAAAAQVPTSRYAPSPKPAQLALTLAAGGSALGKRTLNAVNSGQSVELPSGAVVVPGKKPIKGRRVWVGRAPAGVRASLVQGGHAVTKSGYVITGQRIYVAT
ncbi:MAG TPA: hypothetical protein VFQ35_05925 [Polyangiaceae bacterium]|nr:hypothetical protein [Polyangiaceae bacterium]